MQIDSAFLQKTGCHPYMVICNLHRAKLDCNRNLADGACGNSDAIISWNEFNNFIDTAQANAKAANNGKAFYIDLHGHGNPIQRIELGYLLYDDELEYTDSVLNTPQYIGYSTIQNLVANNVNQYSHAQLLRGPFALGTLLGNSGFPAVPSQQIPYPGINNNYYSGGYNAAHHTSYAIGNTVNGVQMECNYSNIRDTYIHRKMFADSLVNVMMNYLNIHQNTVVANCNESGLFESKIDVVSLYPNPANAMVTIQIEGNENGVWTIFNSLGEVVLKQNYVSNNTQIDVHTLQRGTYVIELIKGDSVVKKKFIKY